MAPGDGAAESNAHLEAFHASARAAGESVLNWVVATDSEGEAGEGVAILTDRRLRFHHADAAEACREVPVLGATLRYAPLTNGDDLLARFETDGGPLSFIVEGEIERQHLGNLLGSLKELREAQARMEMSGLDPAFVSPPREGAAEGVSAIYQLMRLKELLNQGLFGETEFALQRTMMIGRFVDEGATQAPG